MSKQTDTGRKLRRSRLNYSPENTACLSLRLGAAGATSNGSGQSWAETCPAGIQAMRVTSDPTIDDHEAHRRRERDLFSLPNKLRMRRAVRTGPERTPPVRVIK